MTKCDNIGIKAAYNYYNYNYKKRILLLQGADKM